MNHALTMRTDICSRNQITYRNVLEALEKSLTLTSKTRTSGYLERSTFVSTRSREDWFSVDLCFMVE